MAQTTLAHEFFHHAQDRTRVDGRVNLIDRPQRESNWLIEGTAVWFEDELYDALDSYRTFVGRGLPPFLTRRWERGLGLLSESVIDGAVEVNWLEGYQYFAWWKLLNDRCRLSIPEVLNVAADDRWGVRNLAELVNSLAWNCNFTPGFQDAGGPNRWFASALLYYAYATDTDTSSQHNSLGLLEPDEPPIRFQRAVVLGPVVTPSALCNDFSQVGTTCPSSAQVSGDLGRAAVARIAVQSIAEDAESAMFHINNRGDSDLYAFFVQRDLGWPEGAGYWVQPSQHVTVLPSRDTRLTARYTGEWSVFIVNPSADSFADLQLAVGIEEQPEPPPAEPKNCVYSIEVTGYPELSSNPIVNLDFCGRSPLLSHPEYIPLGYEERSPYNGFPVYYFTLNPGPGHRRSFTDEDRILFAEWEVKAPGLIGSWLLETRDNTFQFGLARQRNLNPFSMHSSRYYRIRFTLEDHPQRIFSFNFRVEFAD